MRLATAILILGLLNSSAIADQVTHKKYSTLCFNQCWTLIDNKERSTTETAEMIRLANASYWHWTQRDDVTPLNLSIGQWQLARVYALADEASLAKKHALECIHISEQNKLPAFYKGYAYEAAARAALVASNKPAAQEWLVKAQYALSEIESKDEHSMLKRDLDDLAARLK